MECCGVLQTLLLLCTFLVAATYKRCAVQGFDAASVIQMEFTNWLSSTVRKRGPTGPI